MKKFIFNKWTATIIIFLGIVVLSLVRASIVDSQEIIGSMDFSELDPATVDSVKSIITSIAVVFANPITYIVIDIIGLGVVSIIAAAITRGTVKKDERYIEMEDKSTFGDIFSIVYIALISLGVIKLITALVMMLNIGHSLVAMVLSLLAYGGFIWLILEQLKNEQRELKYTKKVAIVLYALLAVIQISQRI